MDCTPGVALSCLTGLFSHSALWVVLLISMHHFIHFVSRCTTRCGRLVFPGGGEGAGGFLLGGYPDFHVLIGLLLFCFLARFLPNHHRA